MSAELVTSRYGCLLPAQASGQDSMCKQAMLRAMLLFISLIGSLVSSSGTSLGLAAMQNESLPVIIHEQRGGASSHSYATPDHPESRAFTLSDAGAASTAAGFNTLNDKLEG
eukprot:56203-Eustigmatos_ZCMA.PRE.1